jgi:hypothetical protein
MDQDARTVDDRPSRPRFQFRVIHVLYAMALLGVALATFGESGLTVAVSVLGFWAFVFYRGSRPGALADGCFGLVIYACLIGLLLPAIQHHPVASQRAWCGSHLKMIALALHNYHDTHGEFPPAFVPDPDGRPIWQASGAAAVGPVMWPSWASGPLGPVRNRASWRTLQTAPRTPSG